MNYWLVKSEPETYSWDTFVALREDKWDGVRNFQARNNLKIMQLDDLVFFYHSGGAREVVGVAKVTREFYPDPTTDDANWVVVDLKPLHALSKAVTLLEIKANSDLQNVALIRQSRLSVMPLTNVEFDTILQMSTF